MALMGYNPKRKDTPPPVQSVQIYQKNVDIPTSEGRLNIKSQLITAISLIPNTKQDEGKSTGNKTPQYHKLKETPSTLPDGDQFRTWRTKPKKEQRRSIPLKTAKSSKDMNRSRSLTPNRCSSSKPKSAMKRSATFSGKIKSSKAKTLDHFYNAKMMEKTNTESTNYFYIIPIIVVIISIFLCLVFFNSNFSTPPYDHNEILINLTGFQKYINNNFFHQTYTVNLFLEFLKMEVNGEKHSRPLVISFNGGPGVGKTYLAELTAKHLFSKGLDSPCVNNFISSLHITDSGDEINLDIMDWFLQQAVRCPLELYIVDNMEILSPKLVNYLLGRLQEYLLESSEVKSSVLILTSTIGKDQLDRECKYESCYLELTKSLKKELQSWKNDALIEDLKTEDSSFLESSKILAFFPLQREHVKLCAKHVLQRHLSNEKITDELLEKVASEISFVTLENGQTYSISGCKQVAEKTILHL